MTPIRKAETLDPGIAGVVYYLRKGGFDTFASCEGGEGHAFDAPAVRINPHTDMGSVELDIVQYLLDGGYSGFYVKQIRCYLTGPEPWGDSFLEVEFWGKP